MNNCKEIREKIASVMSYIYGVGIMIALFAGALSFFGYLIAIIIGGETATEICTFIYKKIYPILFTYTSCVVIFGLIKMYVAGEKSLAPTKKKAKENNQKNDNTKEQNDVDSNTPKES